MKKFKTEPKIINIEDTNTTIIKIMFFNKHTKEDTIKNRIMNRILRTCNNLYRTPKEFETKREDLLIMNLSIDTNAYIENEVTYVTMTLPREGIIDEFNLEECIKFLHDTLYNPYIENNEFNNEHFNWERDFVLDRERNFPNNIYETLEEETIKVLNEIDDVYITHEEFMNFINKQTSKTIYEHYINRIKNNNFITYIYGNIENKEKILNTFNKYFKQDKEEIEVDNKYNRYFKLTEYKEFKKETKYNQTILDLIYQIKDLKTEEKTMLDTLFYFLNAQENDLIFQNLRVKNNLVYNSRVMENTTCGIINIVAFLNKEDIKKAQEIIEETLEDIKKEENFNIYKERLLKALKYDVLIEEDNDYNIVKDIINKDIKEEKTLKEKYEIIKEITSKDMNNFINRLKLTRKLTMVGEKNE